MDNITASILAKTSLIAEEQEVSPNGPNFNMFNDGGVEVEIAELLYSLVRVWKPKNAVETGTHLGISAAYIAAALQKEQEQSGHKGKVTTYEILPEFQAQAIKLWKDLEVDPWIDTKLEKSYDADIEGDIDFLFLDSEPQLRFDEFIKFFPQVSYGGLIIIHDLNNSLGHHGQTHHDEYDWPYGYWVPKLGNYVKDLKVQTIHVPNPRGCTIFQKTKHTDENIVHLRGEDDETK